MAKLTQEQRMAAVEAQIGAVHSVGLHYQGIIRNIHWAIIAILLTGLGSSFVILNNKIDDVRKELSQDLKDYLKDLQKPQR